MLIQEAIKRITEKKNLSRKEVQEIFGQVMKGEATPAQIAAFLVGMRMKGETCEEITGAALSMREYAQKIKRPQAVVLDTCGTGADGCRTFNVSTLTALVVAGAGVKVAKHGNRAVSSSCGSADLLEALGVNVHMSPALAGEALEEIGIAFLFAPDFHPAMKYAAGVRKEIGVRTLFNILGPLSNPAGATHQLVGVYDAGRIRDMAGVLKNVGLRHALVVHGLDGMDEITTASATMACELSGGRLREFRIKPQDCGITRARPKDLMSKGPGHSKEIALEVLQAKPGPPTDLVVLNAAWALYVADRVRDAKEGVGLAWQSLQSGAALRKIEELKHFSQGQ